LADGSRRYRMAFLCPSVRCEKGAVLLGIVQRNGHISFISKKLLVNDEFVSIAQSGRSPEKRFRFSSKCISTSCKQWTDGRCGVIDRVIDIIQPDREITELPDCSIRSECRWHKQRGDRDCTVCPEIITDLNL
jgi:hypothetical protein